MFSLAFEHILEDEFTQKLGLFGTAQINALDLPADISLLVSKEEVVIATAVDQGFTFQTLEAFFDLTA